MLHSPTIPRCRAVRMAIERSNWYSVSSRVCDGATTIDSPVWIPMGSKFSMLHTVMQLSAASRTISYSISFQPRRLSSTRTCGAPPENARRSAGSSSAGLLTMPLPFPPSENPPRSMTGSPRRAGRPRAPPRSSGRRHCAQSRLRSRRGARRIDACLRYRESRSRAYRARESPVARAPRCREAPARS